MYIIINTIIFLYHVKLDGVEGVAKIGPVYVVAGSNITIIGFINFSANPSPTSVWSFNGSMVSGNRFNVLDVDQLTISTVQLSDAGNYTNTLMNNVVGNPMSTDNTIELFVVGK